MDIKRKNFNVHTIYTHQPTVFIYKTSLQLRSEIDLILLRRIKNYLQPVDPVSVGVQILRIDFYVIKFVIISGFRATRVTHRTVDPSIDHVYFHFIWYGVHVWLNGDGLR